MNAQAPTREVQLLQAGNRLVDHPSSVDELLSLLDQSGAFTIKSGTMSYQINAERTFSISESIGC
jgi:hypothetical protein